MLHPVPYVIVRLRPSRPLAAMAVVLSAAAAALLALMPLPVAVRLAGAVAIIATGAWYCRCESLLKGAHSLINCKLARDGFIEVEDRCGRKLAGCILESSVVSRWGTVIHWRAEGDRAWRRRALWLSGGRTDPVSLRRARVLLRAIHRFGNSTSATPLD